MAIARQMRQIFETDWHAQELIAQGKTAPTLNAGVVTADDRQAAYLVASPNAFNPAGVGDSQTELVRLLAAAKTEVRVQLLDYAPLSYGRNKTRPYYAVIDNAIRAAVTRGVKVKLMVSSWNTEQPAIRRCQCRIMPSNATSITPISCLWSEAELCSIRGTILRANYVAKLSVLGANQLAGSIS